MLMSLFQFKNTQKSELFSFDTGRKFSMSKKKSFCSVNGALIELVPYSHFCSLNTTIMLNSAI